VSALDLLSWLLLILGAGFCVVGSLGLLRLPDFYARTHAASVTDTLGASLVLAGLMIQGGVSLVSAKLGLIVIFIFITSPTAAHALARAAFAFGYRAEVDSEESDAVSG